MRGTDAYQLYPFSYKKKLLSIIKYKYCRQALLNAVIIQFPNQLGNTLNPFRACTCSSGYVPSFHYGNKVMTKWLNIREQSRELKLRHLRKKKTFSKIFSKLMFSMFFISFFHFFSLLYFRHSRNANVFRRNLSKTMTTSISTPPGPTAAV